MADRPTIPASAECVAYGMTDDGSFNTKSVQFGDGYEQLGTEGINPFVGEWSLTWQNVKQAIGAEIVDFLKARKGVESFYWEHPVTGVTHIVHCRQPPQVSYNNPGRVTVTATFKESFNA